MSSNGSYGEYFTPPGMGCLNNLVFDYIISVTENEGSSVTMPYQNHMIFFIIFFEN